MNERPWATGPRPDGAGKPGHLQAEPWPLCLSLSLSPYQRCPNRRAGAPTAYACVPGAPSEAGVSSGSWEWGAGWHCEVLRVDGRVPTERPVFLRGARGVDLSRWSGG